MHRLQDPGRDPGKTTRLIRSARAGQHPEARPENFSVINDTRLESSSAPHRSNTLDV